MTNNRNRRLSAVKSDLKKQSQFLKGQNGRKFNYNKELRRKYTDFSHKNKANLGR